MKIQKKIKALIICVLISSINICFAQVGIDTDTPQADLHVSGNGDLQVEGEILTGGTSTTPGTSGTTDQVLTSNGDGTMRWDDVPTSSNVINYYNVNSGAHVVGSSSGTVNLVRITFTISEPHVILVNATTSVQTLTNGTDVNANANFWVTVSTSPIATAANSEVYRGSAITRDSNLTRYNVAFPYNVAIAAGTYYVTLYSEYLSGSVDMNAEDPTLSAILFKI